MKSKPLFICTLDQDQLDSVRKQIADPKKKDVLVSTYIGPNQKEVSMTVQKENVEFKFDGSKLTISTKEKNDA